MTLPYVAQAAPDHAFGSYEGVLIASWRGEIQLAAVQQLVRFRDELARTGLRGAIHMAEPEVTLPSAEVRKAATSGVATRSDARPAIGLVFFGTGFSASALRAAATAMFVLRSGPPTHMFGDTMQAAHWIVLRSALGLSPLSLRTACESMRQVGLFGANSAVFSVPQRALRTAGQ